MKGKLLAIIAVFCSLAGLTACGEDKTHEHSWDKGNVTLQATCVSDGLKVYTCTECNATKEEVIEAMGHAESAEVKRNAEEATCTQSGSYDSTVYCLVCGEIISIEKTEIEAKGHTPATAVKENETAASCIEAGSYDSVVYCADCHAELERNTVTGEYGEHSWDSGVVISERTLTSDGLMRYTCNVCEDTNDVVIPKGADFSEDFTIEEGGAWKYGYVNYQWGEREDFEFVSATSDGISAWKADGTEIKDGWIDFGAMTTIGYTAETDGAVKLKIRFTGGTALTRAALRIGVKNADGVLYSNPAFHASELNVISLETEFNLKAGDTIYLIFSNEAGGTEGAYPNGDLDITVLQ